MVFQQIWQTSWLWISVLWKIWKWFLIYKVEEDHIPDTNMQYGGPLRFKVKVKKNKLSNNFKNIVRISNRKHLFNWEVIVYE